MIKVPFDQIEKEHIEQLVDEKIEEDRTLDYKREMPDLKNPEQKRNFLKLVASFANTVGGDILYGIEEAKENDRNTGRPEKIVGVSDVNTDQIKLSMLNLIRDSIEPRIVPQVEIKPIGDFDNGPCLIVRVHKSFTGPHALWMNKKALFYSRNSGGTHPMDVTEIRNAFIGSETFVDRLRSFRQNRIELVSEGRTPIPVEGGAKLVIHIIPLDTFETTSKRNVLNILSSNYTKLVHEGCRETEMRYNFDGLVVFCRPNETGEYQEYCQLFTSGYFEIVSSSIGFVNGEEKRLYRDIDKGIFRDVKKFIGLIEELDIVPPIAFFVSFIGVKDYVMNVRRRGAWQKFYPIEHSQLLIPEIIINNFQDDPEAFLSGPFNDLWRACGYPENMNYDENGNRRD